MLTTLLVRIFSPLRLSVLSAITAFIFNRLAASDELRKSPLRARLQYYQILLPERAKNEEWSAPSRRLSNFALLAGPAYRVESFQMNFSQRDRLKSGGRISFWPRCSVRKWFGLNVAALKSGSSSYLLKSGEVVTNHPILPRAARH